MTQLLFRLVVCHLIGDYCLQSDFIAKTKGQNWYHLWGALHFVSGSILRSFWLGLAIGSDIYFACICRCIKSKIPCNFIYV